MSFLSFMEHIYMEVKKGLFAYFDIINEKLRL